MYLLVNRPKVAFQPGGETPIKLVKLENHAAQGVDAASSKAAESTTDQTSARGLSCEQIKEGQWRETRAQSIHATGCRLSSMRAGNCCPLFCSWRDKQILTIQHGELFFFMGPLSQTVRLAHLSSW